MGGRGDEIRGEGKPSLWLLGGFRGGVAYLCVVLGLWLNWSTPPLLKSERFAVGTMVPRLGNRGRCNWL